MSRRNPTNDRYTVDRKGKTRRSAQTARPKTKAASSVRIQRPGKTDAEKKQIKKEKQEKEAKLERVSYKVPTPEYKKLRRIYWALLIPGIGLLTGLMFLLLFKPETASSFLWLMVPAYAIVTAAFLFDKFKIDRLRKAYKAEIAAQKVDTPKKVGKKA